MPRLVLASLRRIMVVGMLGVAPGTSSAAPLLRSADVTVTIASPVSCSVALTLDTAGADRVEHRIEAFEGSRIRDLDVSGATVVDDREVVGHTRALVVAPATGPYVVTYAADLADDRAHRCPLWIPTIPTDGQSRAVRLTVTLPAATSADGSFPALRWNGTDGAATLGHLPAFVYVPLATEGTQAPQNVGRLMDVVTVVVLVGGSVLWAIRRRTGAGGR